MPLAAGVSDPANNRSESSASSPSGMTRALSARLYNGCAARCRRIHFAAIGLRERTLRGAAGKHSPTADKKELQETGNLHRNHVNVQRPRKNQIGRRSYSSAASAAASTKPHTTPGCLAPCSGGFICRIPLFDLTVSRPSLFALSALECLVRPGGGRLRCRVHWALHLRRRGRPVRHGPAATRYAATDPSWHTLRHTPDVQLGTSPVPLGFLSVS